MAIPISQVWTVVKYVWGQKLKGNERYPWFLCLSRFFAAIWLVPVAARCSIRHTF